MRNVSTVRTLGVLTVAVVLGGVLAGCTSSGSPDTEPTASTSQAPPSTTAVTSSTPAETSSSTPAPVGEGACKYVTTEQAAALAHAAVKPGVSRSLPSGPVTFEYCDYIFDPGNAPAVTVAVADLNGNGPSLFAQFRASEQSQSDFQDVSGVGDEAFYSNGNINVLVGDTGLILYVGRKVQPAPWTRRDPGREAAGSAGHPSALIRA